MGTLHLAAGSALWLGLLTSISPCPLATNIAAISYVGKQVDRPVRALGAGLAYTLGRTVSYVLVALVVVKSLLSMSAVSMFLQQRLNQVLGPVLLLVGLVLLDVIPWPWNWTGRGSKLVERIQTRASRLGLLGAGLLGLAFALTFCPVSAALFFGSLLTIAVKARSGVLLPAVYGIGTGLPVLVFAVLIAVGARSLAKVFDKVAAFERWARRVTGVVFLGIGIYYTLAYVFRVF